MLDAYKRKIKSQGGSMANALRNQSNAILNHSFKNDVGYKEVIIDNKNVDARYYTNKSTTITGDSVDYLLQFRPNVTYPVGTYVSIPNNYNVYEDWLIVANSDDVMFPKSNILKCNYDLKWVCDKRIMEYKAVIRSSGDGGVEFKQYMSLVDGQYAIWLPFNDDTKLIDYKTRFIITYNEKNPQSYIVTDIKDIRDKGLTKLTVTRDEISSYDNLELKIANYYIQFPETNTQVNEFTYQFIGSDTLSINTESTYEFNTLMNGEIIESTNAEFIVTDILGQSTDLVTYSIDGNLIKIRTKGIKGTVIIKAVINDTIIEKIIKIKGLL